MILVGFNMILMAFDIISNVGFYVFLNLVFYMLLNVGTSMTTNVGMYMTTNVGIHMTRNVGTCMTTNVRPRRRMCSRFFRMSCFSGYHDFRNFQVPSWTASFHLDLFLRGAQMCLRPIQRYLRRTQICPDSFNKKKQVISR